MSRKFALLATIACFLSGVVSAPALEVTADGRLMTTIDNEEVFVTFVGSTATRTNLLWEHSPGAVFLFDEDTAAPGDTVSLGTFASGLEILFRLDSYEDDALQHSWYTGPASRNIDNIVHAVFIPLAPNLWLLGFEDYHLNDPRFDADYDDMVVLIYNQFFQEPVIPEPATLSLIGMGLGGAAFLKRRRRA